MLILNYFRKMKAEKTITCDQIPGFQGFSGKTAEEKDPEPAPEQKKSVRTLEYFSRLHPEAERSAEGSPHR